MGKIDTASDVLAAVGCLDHAIREKDVDVVLSLMTDDVVIVPALGEPLVGHDAVRATLSAKVPLPWKFEVDDLTEDRSVEFLGNVAVVTGTRSTVITQENSIRPVVAFRGRTISIYRHQVDGWKLARYLSLMAPVNSGGAMSHATVK
jgi:ketosteroid isomerase-like protein